MRGMYIYMMERVRKVKEKPFFKDVDVFLFLSVIFGVITTAYRYSDFGAGNHVEHLPVIIRSLDITYLQNDFFTNASMHSIARLNYARIIAFLAGSESNLPIVFLLFTLCANITISIVTYSFTRKLFNNSPLSGIYASAFVMSVSTFAMGYYSTIYSAIMEPATIAASLIFLAIWFVARGKCVICMFLCGIASIVHPLYGLEMAGVLLFVFVTTQLVNKHKIKRGVFREIILSVLVIITFSLLSISSQLSQERISSELFIYIIAFFRNPHHYVPSTFSITHYINSTAFISATLIIYYQGRGYRRSSYDTIIAVLGSTILLLCVGGYIFVEIFPIRIWVIAQTFRLLYFVKWIGLILVAGMIANKRLENSTKMLYMAGLLHPLALGVIVLSQLLREWLERKQHWVAKIINPSLILLVTITLVIPLGRSSVALLSFYVLLILVFHSCPRKLLYLTTFAGVILTVLFGIFHSRLPYFNKFEYKSYNACNLTSEIRSELGLEGNDVADFARQNTPKDSIFLTPPYWGQFRLLARRAIVVDFKAFLFDDIAMLEWYERITNCYGYPEKRGFAMLKELNENYININDDILLSLQERYKISYAVLDKQTNTNFEVIFQNSKYKVVNLVKN